MRYVRTLYSVLRTGTRQLVEDKRLLSGDGSGTVLQSTGGSGTVTLTESCLRGGNRGKQKMQKIQGKKFKEIYSGFVNGILRDPKCKIARAVWKGWNRQSH